MTNHNKGKNNNQKMDSSDQREAITKLANNLVKNENTIDMSSIMRMATNLLQNDSLMDSVKDLGQYQQNSPSNAPGVQEKQEKTELTFIHEELKKINRQIMEIKKEIAAQKPKPKGNRNSPQRP
ncbi:hypothetical protein [Neobacillus mesonae]|uniref:Uncharacterized protein n=1 Tax=Neobacillus mesonae TaxID=1193713 RepID=A0A3Q9QVL4_9BACI|nr:hypothetical protein [Neobacillus mesonae]AZU62624.1 hypothetical protein CHR53_15875 [Neobacillus mesonae]